MYRLVAPYSPRWALLSIALLLLSNTFITETRAVSLDLLLAAVSFSVFYLGYAAEHFAAAKRHGLILALLVLGFAIRGPIGLVIPTGMLCSYYLLGGQWRRLFVFGFQALGLLVACIGLLLWLAWLDGGDFLLHEVIRMQFTGRMDGSEGSSGVLYYFSSSFGNYALAYPLALLTVAALLFGTRQPRGPALRLTVYCLAAGLIVMLGLSVPQAKKARYILPMLPMIAIVAAFPFQASHGRLFAWLRGLIQGIWLLLPGLLIAGMILLHRRFPEALPTLGLAPWLSDCRDRAVQGPLARTRTGRLCGTGDVGELHPDCRAGRAHSLRHPHVHPGRPAVDSSDAGASGAACHGQGCEGNQVHGQSG